jgi:hypothetical protein
MSLGSAAQAQVVHSNALSWPASPATGATYDVWRAPGSCTGTFSKINTVPVTALTYVDSGMADGAVNCYYVTASVNGVPSVASAKWLATTPTIVPAPPVTPPPGSPSGQSQ